MTPIFYTYSCFYLVLNENSEMNLRPKYGSLIIEYADGIFVKKFGSETLHYGFSVESIIT